MEKTKFFPCKLPVIAKQKKRTTARAPTQKTTYSRVAEPSHLTMASKQHVDDVSDGITGLMRGGKVLRSRHARRTLFEDGRDDHPNTGTSTREDGDDEPIVSVLAKERTAEYVQPADTERPIDGASDAATQERVNIDTVKCEVIVPKCWIAAVFDHFLKSGNRNYKTQGQVPQLCIRSLYKRYDLIQQAYPCPTHTESTGGMQSETAHGANSHTGETTECKTTSTVTDAICKRLRPRTTHGMGNVLVNEWLQHEFDTDDGEVGEPSGDDDYSPED